MVSTIAKTLRPFQVAGADFLARNPHALLADEPGLGKTLQAIAAAQALELRRPLVVCPASVRNGWRQELHECQADHEAAWDILSYEQIVGGRHAMVGHYDGLILDEAHYLKTPDSQRTRAVFGPSGVARGTRLRARWALTGTPVLNRPRELWPIVKSLSPKFAAMSWGAYAQRYCAAYFDGRAIDTRGASNLDELRGQLDGFMLRRTKEEVLTELPDKIVTRVPLEKVDLALVQNAEAEILNREAKISQAAEDFSALGDLSHLLKVTGLAKVTAAAAFVGDLLDTVGDKVVVFCRHREVLAQLAALLGEERGRAVRFEGGMSDAQKAEAITTFRTREACRVFLANIAAGGTGINGLQEVASSVVFAEMSWVPGEMSQAIDRLHRMGQRSRAVSAYVLHAPGTMESAVLAVQNQKGSVVGRLLGEDGWRA